MRFKNYKHPNHVGSERIRIAFLWFPKKIGGEKRWLEISAWKQKQYYNPYSPTNWYWKDKCWIDQELNEKQEWIEHQNYKPDDIWKIID